MSIIQRRTMFIAGITAALFLTACGSAGGDPRVSSSASTAILDPETGFAKYTGTPQKGGIVTVLGGVDFSSLDPAKGNDGNANNLYNLLYRTLTSYALDPTTGEVTLVGDLAEDTGTSNDDATVWTFKLKEGLKFENGDSITAADVKFGIERSFDPTLAIGSDYLQTYLVGGKDYKGVFEQPEGLDSIVVKDDLTIEFTTKAPMADFPEIVASSPGTPFPKAAVTSAVQIQDNPIASGPYRVEKYSQGNSLTLVRNENWDASSDAIRPAYPDGYKFVLGLDPSTIDQRMLAGQGEDANAIASSTNPLVPANLSRVQSDPKISARTVQSIPGCNYYMAMKTTEGPLSNLKVRQALNFAMDKASIVNATGGPLLASPAPNMLLPSVPGYVDSSPYDTEGSKGDLKKAKELLAEAGFAGGINLTMDVRGLPMWQAQAEAVQQSLAKVGVNLTLNVINSAKFYEVIQTRSQQNALAITGWCASGWFSGEGLLGPMFSGDRITDTGNPNQSQINDASLNEALDAAAVIPDIDEKNKRYIEIGNQVMDLAPVVPLVRPNGLQLTGSNVAGAVANPAQTGYIDYSQLGLIDPER